METKVASVPSFLPGKSKSKRFKRQQSYAAKHVVWGFGGGQSEPKHKRANEFPMNFSLQSLLKVFTYLWEITSIGEAMSLSSKAKQFLAKQSDFSSNLNIVSRLHRQQCQLQDRYITIRYIIPAM